MLLAGLMCYVVLQFAIGVWVSRRITTDTDYILAGRSLGPYARRVLGVRHVVRRRGDRRDDGRGLQERPRRRARRSVRLCDRAGAWPGSCSPRVLWRHGLTTFADLFERRYSPTDRQARRARAAARLDLLGRRADPRVRSGDELGFRDEPVDRDRASRPFWSAPTPRSAACSPTSVTDFLQGLVVIFGLLVLTVVVAGHAGGIAGAIVATDPERLQLLASIVGRPARKDSSMSSIAICGSMVAVELISRYLGARSAEVARTGTIVGGLLYCVVGLVPVFLGLSRIRARRTRSGIEGAARRCRAGRGDAGAQYYMPTFGYVIFAGAIISAILSNVHSSLHAPAAQVSHNIDLEACSPICDSAGQAAHRARSLCWCCRSSRSSWR